MIRRNTWKVWAGALASIVVLIVVGLGATTSSGARTVSTQPAAKQAAAAANSLVIANFDVPTSLDPESPQLGHEPSDEGMAQVYEPLIAFKFKQNPDGTRFPNFAAGFEPRLASSWTISPDKRTWTFSLRHGVKSAWGNEFTADDVVWSAQRAFGLKGVGKFLFTVGGVASAGSVQKVDKYKVRFTLSTPTRIFPLARVLFIPPIFDSTEVKKHVTSSDPWASTWISKNGGGFGPYVVDTWEPGRVFVLKPNPNYYRGTPAITSVTVQAVPSSATRLASLQSGAVDIAEQLSPREVDSLKGQKGVKVADVLPGNRNEWLILNSSKPPLNNARVRQAIAYAVPYNDIVKFVFFGHATVYKNVVPLGYPDVTTKFWHYNTNLGKAKSLLKQAGVGSGFSLTLNYSAGFPEDEQVAILVRDSLGKIGIKVTLAKVTPAIFSTMKITKSVRLKTQMLLSSADLPWVPDYVYASLYFFRSDALFNLTWKDPKFDKLDSQAAVEVNSVKRHNLIVGMQKILMDQMPFVPIVMTGLPVPMRSNVNNYTWWTDNFMRFDDMSKS